jgi:hypothetical protein
MCLEICPFLLAFPIYLNIGFKIVPNNSLNFIVVCCNLPFFISNFINLHLFPHHFSQICQGFVNLIYLFEELVFCFLDSSNDFFGLYFIGFCPYIFFLFPFGSFGFGLFLKTTLDFI